MRQSGNPRPDHPSEPAPSAGDVLQALFRASHHFHRQFELGLTACSVPAYLTGPRVRFLAAVMEAGQVRMGDMADKLGIQARTVTQFVDALEQEGLLVRLPDPKDRRATLLQVTEKALPLVADARAAMSRVAAQVLSPLTVEQRRSLYAILSPFSVGS